MIQGTLIKGHASLTSSGKQRVAISMYEKGTAFIGAYFLLHRTDGSESVDYVALHNLCQGIEIALKGLLLLSNYDLYKPRLKLIGHDLNTVVSNCLETYGLKPMSADVGVELHALSNLYSKQLLRYGSGYDILVDPRTIQRDRVLRRIGAAVRLVKRELKRGEVI